LHHQVDIRAGAIWLRDRSAAYHSTRSADGAVWHTEAAPQVNHHEAGAFYMEPSFMEDDVTFDENHDRREFRTEKWHWNQVIVLGKTPT
jgi:hypothetical protein